jgi:hypothetical protein
LQLARNFSLHFDLMIQERYDGVAMMLQWWYNDVTIMWRLMWCLQLAWRFSLNLNLNSVLSMLALCCYYVISMLFIFSLCYQHVIHLLFMLSACYSSSLYVISMLFIFSLCYQHVMFVFSLCYQHVIHLLFMLSPCYSSSLYAIIMLSACYSSSLYVICMSCSCYYDVVLATRPTFLPLSQSNHARVSWWCYDVFHWCYDGVMMVLQRWDSAKWEACIRLRFERCI